MDEKGALKFDIAARDRKIQEMEDDNDRDRRRIKEIERSETTKEPKFSVDDRGNEVNFYVRMDDGTFEPGARLDREAGPSANENFWDNWSGDDLEEWAKENGYRDEIAESIKAKGGFNGNRGL